MSTIPSLSSDEEAQLAELADQLVRRLQEGGSVDLEVVCRQYPRLAGELRMLWGTILMTEGLAASSHASFAGEPGVESSEGNSRTVEKVRTDSTWRHLWKDTPDGERGDAALRSREVDDYVLLDELGRGGMGVVYRARQKSLDRIVALKMILQGRLASSIDIARFRSEAESAARLDHPHIVPVYEVGTFENRPYFSMKLIEGTTLARRIIDGPIPNREAAEIMLPICRAIGDAHRRGVLHRDLKPSNILIEVDGTPYVSDFGLAKRFSMESDDPKASATLTQSGAILGTPGYMAPEQAAGQRGEVSTLTDVYSLGAVLYALLTGRPPFQASSPVDTILLVLEQDPVPPRMLNPKADSDLEMIALKCLQKPADLRYATPDAMADDLEAYLHNEPIAARSSHFTQVITRAFRETHHAQVLENWGLLWMWHSFVVLQLCLITNLMHWQGVVSRWPYVALWSVGVGIWAFIFWELRRRSGPITFVERQIAHVWAASTICSTLLFFIEWMMNLPVLTLSPVLALLAGAVFLIKAGVLSGKFYVQALVLYATAFVMAGMKAWTDWDLDLTIYGIVVAWSFFAPGLKYYRQRHAV